MAKLVIGADADRDSQASGGGGATRRTEDLSVRLLALRPLHRRTLAGLGAMQIVGGVGTASAVAAGGLLAHDLFGSDSLAGLPMALAVAGTAAAAIPLASRMRRAGRRSGLRAGWLVGCAGAVLIALAAITRMPVLLLLGMPMFGWAVAASDAARFAAADLALPRARGASIGFVLFAATVSGIAGPLLVEPSVTAARSLGITDLAGPFMLSAAAFGAAAVILTVSLRPDPLHVIGAASAADGQSPSHGAEAMTRSRMALLSLPVVRVAVLGAAVTNFVMVFVMTVSPVHLVSHGETLHAVGVVLSAHIAGMFAPSPLSGWLCDRLGSRAVLAVGGAAMIGAGIAAAASGPSHQFGPLLLLGVGWNLGHVASSALLVDGTSPPERIKAQGLAETARGGAAMTGVALTAAALATVVIALGGWQAVSRRWSRAQAPILGARPAQRPPDATGRDEAIARSLQR